jgi:hypothetical protein
VTFARFQPLHPWPYPSTPSSGRRFRYRFSNTVDLLEAELDLLNARAVVIAEYGCVKAALFATTPTAASSPTERTAK